LGTAIYGVLQHIPAVALRKFRATHRANGETHFQFEPSWVDVELVSLGLSKLHPHLNKSFTSCGSLSSRHGVYMLDSSFKASHPDIFSQLDAR
jgi:hypothetical protein